MPNNKINQLIGLAYRANKLIIGTDNIIKNIDKIKLLIISPSLSMETLKKINHELNIKYIVTSDPNTLSNSLGLNNVKVIGVIEEGFKDLILNSL